MDEFQMRRVTLGKSSQTFTPQKWEPSVQMGVVTPARRWQGGPMCFAELRMDFAELGDFVERGLVDFFLSVEAGAHGPFVEEVEERAGFDEANGFGVGQKIERDFVGDAAIEELIFGVPGVVHGAVVDFFGARIVFEQSGSDVVGLARVGEREQRARAGNHAVALVLAVGGVADFFGESVIGVLQRAHHGCVDADVESFQAIEIARGIEQAVESFGVGAIGGGEAENGAIGRCDDRRARWRNSRAGRRCGR